MKRIICLMLAMAMALSIAVTASAADEPPIQDETVVETAAIADTGADQAPVDRNLPQEDPTDPTDAPDPTDPPAQPDPTEQVAATQPSAAADYPILEKIAPAKDGLKVIWKAYAGAKKYRVFLRRNGAWKGAGDTAALSLTVKDLKAYSSYTFTVRAIGASGAFVGGYDRKGLTFTYTPAPVLTKLESVVGGLRLKWKTAKGAAGYRVYRKSGDTWKILAQTETASYTDKTVKAGKKYTYTVRALNKKKRTISYYDRKGLTGTYTPAPELGGVTPVSSGLKITWSKSSGAAYYRVFLKSGSEWSKLGDTTSTSYTHKKLTDGKIYTYTVRALNKQKKALSGYDHTGVTWRYIAPPEFCSIEKTDGGIFLSWDPKDGADQFRVSRKIFGGEWTSLGVTPAYSMTDSSAQNDTLYAYTLCALDASGKAVSSMIDSSVYYLNGALAQGKITVDGKALYFNKGKVRQGFVTEGGKTYYYDSKGNLQKNGVVGSKSEGYRYADKNGVIDYSFTGVAKNASGCWYLKKGKVNFSTRIAVSYGGADWNVLNGKAVKVKTEAQRTLFRALKVVAKVTKTSMTKEEKLRACWNYVKTAYNEKNPRIPHYKGMDWPVIYANDMFVRGTGNCLSYGAAFAYMAKAIGYENVYCCHSGGHGWAEIDGLVYDPEWARHRFKYNYYGLSYDTKTDQNYKGAISAGLPWMHVKI